MKKLSLALFFCFAVSLINTAAQSGPARLELSFSFNRQSGFASNQFVVWIEDAQGRLVKTLFATRFTASGGWEKRPQSIPLWVKQSGLAALNKKDIDAFTGATPRTGIQTCRWDGRDLKGGTVPAGEYRLFLEASLRDDNRVIYRAPFTLGNGADNPVEAEVKAEYFGSSSKERGMIENVKAVYRP
jgi:hypothetical protein